MWIYVEVYIFLLVSKTAKACDYYGIKIKIDKFHVLIVSTEILKA